MSESESYSESRVKAVLNDDLLAVLEPVLDWYQSDEEDPREPLDILRDIVSDLQCDRKAVLVMSSAATDALALCHQIERCGCSAELTEAIIMASRLRAKLHSANAKRLASADDNLINQKETL